MPHTSVAISVPLAICAAASFGAAAALQQRAARRVPEARLTSTRLLRDLLRQEGFVPSIGLAAMGFVLQGMALAFGPLTLVQPLLITGTLFFIGFACYLNRRPVDVVLVLAASLALAGLTAFILVARPETGAAHFDTAGALPFAVGMVAVVGVCLVLATRLSGDARVLPLAVATAVCYGVAAGLLRSLASEFDGDLFALAGRWQLYALAVVGVAGFSLNQQAYQKGLLGTLAVATITVGDPAVSIGVGIAWLGESIRGGPAATVGEVVSLLVVAGGILLIHTRSQWLTQRLRGHELPDALHEARPRSGGYLAAPCPDEGPGRGGREPRGSWPVTDPREPRRQRDDGPLDR
ncbi:DMT family transporter [Actinopolymorpha sp. B9G3]|uniref:DMT family transporter n=1 Tax=Actinopolymorpha sp. B9G3 TaxID=3158970 RepID=UPI0032D939F1